MILNPDFQSSEEKMEKRQLERSLLFNDDIHQLWQCSCSVVLVGLPGISAHLHQGCICGARRCGTTLWNHPITPIFVKKSLDIRGFWRRNKTAKLCLNEKTVLCSKQTKKQTNKLTNKQTNTTGKTWKKQDNLVLDHMSSPVFSTNIRKDPPCQGGISLFCLPLESHPRLTPWKTYGWGSP